MSQAFLLDLVQCIGCNGCTVACSTGNTLPEGMQFIRVTERVSGTFPDLTGGFDNHRCYHCADAACVNVCPTGALFQEDGLTRLDRDTCIGCSYCVQSCPWDVPVIFEGKASKCDGCRSTVNAGGTPWCVATCPSDALMFGTREELLAEAYRRVGAVRDKYPSAQVYGERQAGGLGMVVVLPDSPTAMGLPEDPQVPLATTAWQRVVKPLNVGITAATMLVAGLAAIIARRNHHSEMALLEAAAAEIAKGDARAPSPGGTPPGTTSPDGAPDEKDQR